MTREEAIRLLTNIKGYTHITLYEWLDVEKVALDMAIEALSTERTGEWVFRTDIPIGGGAESAGYVCSECGTDVNCPYNYCHNCGAKMGGDAE